MWRASAGRGAVYSTTALSPRDKPPYAIVLIDLDEGYRMMSRIEGVDAEATRIDDRVSVRFTPAGEDVLPLFVPDRGDR
nr:OB-fold domain-containing protein [Nocardioides marinisabuli]